MPQYMFGPDYLVAPVINEDDCVRIELPEGDWRDNLGETHNGPKILELKDVLSIDFLISSAFSGTSYHRGIRKKYQPDCSLLV